jgi:hypothetical protein
LLSQKGLKNKNPAHTSAVSQPKYEPKPSV